MEHSPVPRAEKFSPLYPSPPRLHWAVLLSVLLSAEGLALWLVPRPARDVVINLVTAAWPIYLCIWVRKIDRRSTSLYWAVASLVTGFLFSWLLWIVVIFEIREEILEHYNRREPIHLRLNWILTALFSFVYFQYELNKITKEKEASAEFLLVEPEKSLIA
jgi:hypothetical protein